MAVAIAETTQVPVTTFETKTQIILTLSPEEAVALRTVLFRGVTGSSQHSPRGLTDSIETALQRARVDVLPMGSVTGVANFIPTEEV